MSKLKKTIEQKSFQTNEQEAIVSLIFCGQSVRMELETVCQQEKITLSQFNILRILKGVFPAAHPRSEIRRRMIDKSDVTRLIDKLEDNGMVKRIGAKDDKRHSLTMITEEGLSVLERLNGAFTNAHGKILSGLEKEEVKTLISLLKKIQ